MAITQCKECGQLVSSSAKACPHCGKDRGSLIMKGISKVVTVVGVLFALVVGYSTYRAVAVISSATPTAPTTTPTPAPQTKPENPDENTIGHDPWRYNSTQDEMSGEIAWLATKASTNMVHLDFPYQGGTTGIIFVRKHPRHGNNIIFSINKGQLICGASDGCVVSLRFDDQPMININASEPSDHSSNTLFLADYDYLVDTLKTAKQLIIEVQIYQHGLQRFHFEVAGFQAH